MSDSIPTQRDLAAACGVSVATVSLALRGHPRISEQTRAMVLKKAEELGYHLDPTLSQWARQRWRERPESPLVGVLSQRSSMATQISRGARKAAQQMGYRLQRFDMRKPTALADELKDLGIRGLIVEGHNDDSWYDDFPFEDFVAVAMGMGAGRPPLDLVKSASYYNSELMAQHICSAGHQRVLFINELFPMSVNERMQFAALLVAADSGAFELLPALHIQHVKAAALQKTIRQMKPDCIVANSRHAKSLQIPKYSELYVFNADKQTPCPGVDLCFPDVGERAMELLDQYLALHKYGRTASPVTIEVPGRWHLGVT